MSETSDLSPGRRRQLAATFGTGGANYEALRPSYPPQAVAWVTEGWSSPARIVDVGAGTGKLARLLAAAGHQVTAVDPSADMLAQLQGSPVTTQLGTGERLPLPDASVDLVVYAQAWHWVDPVAATREARRVLRPGGRLGLVWNVRDDQPKWQRRLGEVMQAPPAEHSARRMAENPSLPGGFGDVRVATFGWTRTLSRRLIADLTTTRSEYLELDTAGRAEHYGRVVDFLAREFPHLALDDEVELAYQTYCFRAPRE